MIWPGGWGIREGELATTTIARELIDAQGNPIKDAQGNSQTETLEVTINAPGKSLWDGLNLLGILGVPLILFIMGTRFQKSQQEQADKEAREEVLQLYFDRISALLIEKNLMAIADQGDDALPRYKTLLEASLNVIRARTLAILRRFDNDPKRKSSIIRFLAEAEIIGKLQLNLNKADVSYINLSSTDLGKAQLFGANLSKSNFMSANLKNADLRITNLKEANLIGAYLEEAKIGGSNLIGAYLQAAQLRSARLTGTNCERANFKGANLRDADLGGSKLMGADLTDTNLKNTDLGGIEFDDTTIWPAPEKVAAARSIPDNLKKKLGLLPSSNQQNQKPPQ